MKIALTAGRLGIIFYSVYLEVGILTTICFSPHLLESQYPSTEYSFFLPEPLLSNNTPYMTMFSIIL